AINQVMIQGGGTAQCPQATKNVPDASALSRGRHIGSARGLQEPKVVAWFVSTRRVLPPSQTTFVSSVDAPGSSREMSCQDGTTLNPHAAALQRVDGCQLPSAPTLCAGNATF